MEKQETEMKRKPEMETGNGNWKQKWEQKNAPITGYGKLWLHTQAVGTIAPFPHCIG